MSVIHDRGAVYVDGRCVANEVINYGRPKPNEEVRRRTPDEWWERVAEIVAATRSPNDVALGPMGLGVDFYAWDDGDGLLIDREARQAIAWEAFEAAREVILAGIAEEARRFAPAVAAICALRDQEGQG